MLKGWNTARGQAVEVVAAIAPLLRPTWTRETCERSGLAQAPGEAATGFDAAHYSRKAGRSFRSVDAALLHYLMVGSGRDWEPRPGFSPRRYLQENPDVFFAGYEPFAHHQRFGRHEGRGDGESGRPPGAAELPIPSLAEMLSRPRPSTRRAVVDVVIPVYGNRRLTLGAIDSVLRAGSSVPFELIVLDDASPDPGLVEDLRTLAAAGLFTLIVNDRNQGFVRSANRGLLLHPDRDVVLLNSDTEVFGDWLDRLLSALHGAPEVATATPLSNAATIFSYPTTLRDNVVEAVDLREMDRLCRSLDLEPVDVPTAVGFCMAIRRACLDQVGVFDAVNFGRGYGEENDFCMRASARGWRHVSASNVLVWHKGGASFQGERDQRIQNAQLVLNRLHPTYGAEVRAFIDRDPLRAVRSRIDCARVAAAPAAKVLKLAGGSCRGSERRVLTVELVPEIGPFHGQSRVVVPQMPNLPNLPRLDEATPDRDLASLLSGLRIDRVSMSSSATPGSLLHRRLLQEATRLGIPVVRDGGARGA
jgi:GT2 family glycosyltransferase